MSSAYIIYVHVGRNLVEEFEMNDTQEKILDLAECLTQERGFSGFSYLDLADRIGIKAASIHYYFKGKDDLAVALVERTREMHSKGFEQMDANIKAAEKRLKAVVEFFQGYVQCGKFCLCGMMAAELHSLNPAVRKLVDSYFLEFQNWLAKQFKEMGHKDTKLQAIRFLSALEGSLLLARLRHDPKIIDDALREFFKN